MRNLPAGIKASFMLRELVIALSASCPRAASRVERPIRDSASRHVNERIVNMGNSSGALKGETDSVGELPVSLQQLPGPEPDYKDRRQPGNDSAGARPASPHIQNVEGARQ